MRLISIELRLRNRVAVASVAALVLAASACGFIAHTIATGGEQKLKPPPAEPIAAPRVIIFGLDGATYDNMMAAIRSGKAPNIASVLGKDAGNGLFEHGYSAPKALCVLPAVTIANWSAIFTGQTPAWDGVPGDEWFDRRTMRFYAPVPLSVRDTTDLAKIVTEDLVGNALKTPTLYAQIPGRSNVSLLSVYKGATLYTTVTPASMVGIFGEMIAGKAMGEPAEKSLSSAVDLGSVPKLLDAINEHGIPNLQVVYFPGVDTFTHESKNPLQSQLRYIEQVSDQGVGEVLDFYRKKNALDGTYVMFLADHGHIPVMDDHTHALATGNNTPFALLRKAGFRVRKPSVELGPGEDDFQAVLAYEGFIAYVYLADRSTCAAPGRKCDWARPPRFKQDVMPAARAFDEANRTGKWVPALKGTLDLIFARVPAAPGHNSSEYEIYDRGKLVPIYRYLMEHPRPDLIDLDERMRWLSAGPYGDRAGDVLLLSKASMALPISQRYYFSAVPHYSMHGSAEWQDGHVPLILARVGGSGVKMRAIVRKIAGAAPSERSVTPIVKSLFKN
ncbi:MAG: alkaline phosphatase family protein [Candidatus Binataceae bacterium]